MDMRVFYQKIRDLEDAIGENSVLTVSLSTPDGGKEGVLTEVPKRIAARTVVEGKARLATPGEIAAYRAEAEERRKEQEERALVSQARFSVIAESDLKAIRSSLKPGK
jgi:hypothetical protein